MSDADRIMLLEERYAHLQRHQTEQDKVMLELAEELARLKRELAGLKATQAGPGAGGGGEEAAEERPPHY